MIAYRKGPLRVIETWFDEPAQAVGADILRCIQRSQPTAAGIATQFYTLLIDLSDEPEKLLAKMNKETRYEIRRAEEKDRIQCQMWRATTHSSLNDFRSFYDRFAAERALAPANHEKLQKFADRSELVLSIAQVEDGRSLVWHSYYRAEQRLRLLHSATYSQSDNSISRALLGRANRYLHWRDILQFHADGARFYDFGGWYEGTDPKRSAINRFKQGFGGEVALNYNCLCGLTLIGSATVWMHSKLSSNRSSSSVVLH